MGCSASAVQTSEQRQARSISQATYGKSLTHGRESVNSLIPVVIVRKQVRFNDVSSIRRGNFTNPSEIPAIAIKKISMSQSPILTRKGKDLDCEREFGNSEINNK